jgi:hypothetical protein
VKTSLHVALNQGAGESSEHKAIIRAVHKAGHDHARAIKNLCRLYAAKSFDALPKHVQRVALDVLPDLVVVKPRG